jgi:hypothetical protein
MENISIDVIVKYNDGKTNSAFYNYQDQRWYSENGKKLRKPVFAWKSKQNSVLKEVLKGENNTHES